MMIDPAENRLTEAFASILERVEGLGAQLVAEWCDIAEPEGALEVRTQRTTASGKFVDLELVFGDIAGPDLRVWVEIKHGAGLHQDQLENYEADIAFEKQRSWRLTLLAPRTAMPHTPPQVDAVTWQTVAVSLRALDRRGDLSEVDRWLVDEFVTYLKEEALTDEEALTAAHAFALSARPSSERAIARVIEFARVVVDAEWGMPTGFKKKGGSTPDYGVGWWSAHTVGQGALAATSWGDAWFDWTLLSDEFRPDSHDGIAFFAGPSFKSAKDNPTNKAGNEAWLASLRALGFERVQSWYWRLWRSLYPEQLMVDQTVEEQGRRLGEWVVESFRQAAANPPPA
jgi:hypothetical protein